MLTISDNLTPGLTNLINLMPKITAKALNDVAFQIQREIKRELPTWIKVRRRNFLALGIDKATETKPEALVGFMPRADPIIGLIEYGGINLPKPGRKYIKVPMPRVPKSIKRYKTRKRYKGREEILFTQTIGGVKGLWSRTPRALKLVIVYKKQTHYKGGMTKFESRSRQIYTNNFHKYLKSQFIRRLRN
jgi:hypothetical protein